MVGLGGYWEVSVVGWLGGVLGGWVVGVLGCRVGCRVGSQVGRTLGVFGVWMVECRVVGCWVVFL